jgi:hypothetical protein
MRRKDSLRQMPLPEEKPGGDREAQKTIESVELTKGTQCGGAIIDKERSCGAAIPAGTRNATY